MDSLICNFKECYKELTETAVITTCSHIFCQNHGNNLKLALPTKCFACNHELSAHQVLETNLNLSVNSKKLVLSGLDPETILAIAKSAISFWNYQKKHENNITKRRLNHVQARLQIQTKQNEEKESRISILEQEIEKLKSQKNSLKAEVVSMTELQNQRAKKAKRDEYQF